MQPNHSANAPKEIIFKAPFAVVLRNTVSGQQQLSATRSFRAGEVISPFFAGFVSNIPNYLTVQISENKHITLQPEFLQYINHSCDPNAFFDTSAMQLVSLKDIAENEEFTFFYPSTEWEMDQPFVCQCGSPKCLQLIQGASFLSTKVLQQYRLTQFIEEKLLHKVNAEISR